MSAKFCPFCGNKFDIADDVRVIRYKNKLTFYRYLFIGREYGIPRYIVAQRNNYWQILSPVTARPIKDDKYDDIDYPYSGDPYYQYLRAKKNGRWGVVNPITGVALIDFVYDKIERDGHEFLFYDGRHWGKIDVSTKEVIIPFEYDEINGDLVKKNGLWGKYQKNELIIPCEYITLNPYRPSQHKNRKWGVISRSGKVFVPFKYEEIVYSEPFGHSLFYFRNGDKWGLFVLESEKTYPCIYTKDEVNKLKW